MLRALLLHFSENPRFGRWVMRNGPVRRMAMRFVAGETLDDAVRATRAVNQAGMSVTLDLLGENVTTEADARRACASYQAVVDRIAREQLNSNVSLKLTQLGLDLDDSLCQSLVEAIVERASSYGNFVRIDMEGSLYTERTIALVQRVRDKYERVGAVIQSYLYRSERDVLDLLAAGSSVRLVKGAYNEPPSIAFPKKSDVDRNFVALMRRLLASPLYHAIATHDPRMIAATARFAGEHALANDRFEFQMLYGIRPDLQRRLLRQGYRVRVYIPFGRDWFPYFMRRLAERPANLLFFLRNLVRSG
jgi:proline dehydrogenase